MVEKGMYMKRIVVWLGLFFVSFGVVVIVCGSSLDGVGGASMFGGRGTALGALLGTLIMAVIEDGIQVMHGRPEYTKVIVGISTIIAVAIDSLSVYLISRRGKRA